MTLTGSNGNHRAADLMRAYCAKRGVRAVVLRDEGAEVVMNDGCAYVMPHPDMNSLDAIITRHEAEHEHRKVTG